MKQQISLAKERGISLIRVFWWASAHGTLQHLGQEHLHLLPVHQAERGKPTLSSFTTFPYLRAPSKNEWTCASLHSPVIVIFADHFEVPSRTLCFTVFICWACVNLLSQNTSLIKSKISGLFRSRIFIRSFMAMMKFWVLSSAPCFELFSAAPVHQEVNNAHQKQANTPSHASLNRWQDQSHGLLSTLCLLLLILTVRPSISTCMIENLDHKELECNGRGMSRFFFIEESLGQDCSSENRLKSNIIAVEKDPEMKFTVQQTSACPLFSSFCFNRGLWSLAYLIQILKVNLIMR